MTSRFRKRFPPPARADGIPPFPDPGDWPAPGSVPSRSKTNTKGYRDASGQFWSSKAEYNFFVHLQALEAVGAVRDIRTQVPIRYDLWISLPGQVTAQFYKHRSLRADFVVALPVGTGWLDRVIDVKGWATEEYREKAAILEQLGVTVYEVPANDWSDRNIEKRARAGAPAPTYW